MRFHAKHIRAQFPSLRESTPDGRLPIFLDNPAGTQAPQSVIDAVSSYYRTMNANSGGSFITSRRNDAMTATVRQHMADFINAESASEIVIGPNMTTLNFKLSRALAQMLTEGDEIIVTRMDHDANIAPWIAIAKERKLDVKWVDIHTDDCTLDMDSLEDVLSERAKILATVHASNAVGTVNPVRQIAAMARAVGAIHVVDAVQSAPHIPIDVQAIDCDFLLCSSYKFYGPHLGVMWGREELLNSLPIDKVRPAKDQAPYRWETGTPSYETWNGLLACLQYWEMLGRCYGEAELPDYQGRRQMMKRGMAAVQEYERELAEALTDGLLAIPGITVAGITDRERFHRRVPTLAFAKAGRSPDDVAEYLARHDVFVWSGDYYAPEIMQRLGRPEGMVRVGIAHYNTKAEINRLLELIDSI